MRRSENFLEVINAIEKAKCSFKSLNKSSKNPHFKSDYADLDEVLDSIKDSLRMYGVAINQFPDYRDGVFVLTTLISHPESKAYIESDYFLLLEKNTSQAQGSALTYARRYSLTSIFQLHEFDDDGNTAVQAQNKSTQTEKVLKQIQPKKDEIREYMHTIKSGYVTTNPKLHELYEEFKANKIEKLDVIKARFDKEFVKVGK